MEDATASPVSRDDWEAPCRRVMVIGALTVESQIMFTVSPVVKDSPLVGEVIASKPAV